MRLSNSIVTWILCGSLTWGCSLDFSVPDSQDTDPDNETESEENGDSNYFCDGDTCTECTSGPCCNEFGQLKGPSDGSCEQFTEYRCLSGVCGSNRQYRVVERFCTGTTAACNGYTSEPTWEPLSNCKADEVCELDENNMPQCRRCGQLETCQSGVCACEFDACSDLCCREGYVCRWPDSCGVGETKLLPSDGAEYNSFGSSVSISGDMAIVGACDHYYPKSQRATYIFERNEASEWIQKSKLLPANVILNDHFGNAVSLNGTVAIVGAYGDDDNGPKSGAAYIFERSEAGDWIQKYKLLPHDGAKGANFGYAVSVSGNFAIVGAYGDDDNGSNSGAAYIFARNEAGDWIQKYKLLPHDGTKGANFGYAVSVSGNFAIIGASGDDFGSGAAYVFELKESGKWYQNSKLLPSDDPAIRGFGRSVSVSGQLAIIGADQDDSNELNSGAAYIFKRNGSNEWHQNSRLLPSDGPVIRGFGRSVSISGYVAIVGADLDKNLGAAYIFTSNDLDSWTQISKLLPSDVAENDHFGAAVSISGDMALVGAYGAGDGRSDSGSAYIF